MLHIIIIIIPRARMGSESIAHEAEGRMGVQSEATKVCEFRAKIPAFSCSLLSAASHTFEEKSFSQRVFSR